VPIFSAPRLLVEGALTGPGAVSVEGGRILEVLTDVPPPGPDHVALTEGILTPGLVDVQINGMYGVDFIAATDDEWESVSRRMTATGVTAYVPTYITAPVEELAAGLDRAAAARSRLEGSTAARIAGVHVEGPFLSRCQSGAHAPELMVDPTPDQLDVLLAGEAERGVLVLLTRAPERAHALEAIRRLCEAGVTVSLGHTDATAAVVRAATDAGARMVTHLFNAQRPLGHREPGVPGHGLADDRLTLGLIADLKHVAGDICCLVLKAAAGRVALVTDAIAAAEMPPGRYVLGGVDVTVGGDGHLPRRADGTIAGSVLTLDRAVRNLVGLGCDPAVVLDAATRVPADAIQSKDIGRLAPGAHADLVWWSDDLHPMRVWVGGEEANGPRA